MKRYNMVFGEYKPKLLEKISAAEMPYPGIEIADTACILENMMLEATEQGLGSVVIWGSGMTVEHTPISVNFIK